MTIKRIVFPVDLSDFSSSIVPQVISLAEKFGAEIHIVAVLEYSGSFGTAYSFSSSDDLPATTLSAEQKLLEFERESFINYRNVKRILLFGRPADRILDYVISAGADLVMMATHRRSEIERTLLGSVADEVIRKSPVPVMSIKPGEDELGWRVSNVNPDQELKLRPEWPDAGC